MANKYESLLLGSRLGKSSPQKLIRNVYGHSSWTEDLDVVNELGGHSSCVNALSWSTSGALLASGSDDTYLNIWAHNPSDIARPFTLHTSVSTGHHANIFSVKFMPHSGDRTVVTCAGDSEVRVFDLEHSTSNSHDNADDGFSSSTRSRRVHEFFPNARWLNESNTNARVYRSHAERAKRVVTESSPHLFLTCAEDGEVRQWDLRMPSSFYPPPRNARGWSRYNRTAVQGSDNVPPPLISYKRYNLDLNSISCAASQPHYIALGGAHLHCFLHDRRMLGRDRDVEAGRPAGKTPEIDTADDEAMGEATRCVKRFAPNERRRMTAHNNGHITACKISEANPNEMVVSWSSDYIYSFDLVQSPDARDASMKKDESFQAHRLKNKQDRKRKRKPGTASSTSVVENDAPPRRLRRVSDQQEEDGSTALRTRYENEEGEDASLDSSANSMDSFAADVQDALLGGTHRVAERLARGVVKLRSDLFALSGVLSETAAASMENANDLTPHTSTFTSTLGQCHTLLSHMDDLIREWSYPIEPDREEVARQNTLREYRQASWRLVQAAGCLSRVLGGRLQTLSDLPDPRLVTFSAIRPAVHESRHITRESTFCYDFLKAILCWIEGGQASVLEAFIRPSSAPLDSPRFPLIASDTVDVSTNGLEHYLMSLADEGSPIIDLDTNRFETDQRRHMFPSETAAVKAFCRALSGIELQANLSQNNETLTSSSMRIMDKGAAARFWVLRVGRSLLMRAAEGVNFDFVLRAFEAGRVRQAPEESEASFDETDTGNADTISDVLDAVAATDTATTADETTSTDTPRGEVLVAADSTTIEEETNDGNDQDVSSDEDDSDDEERPQAFYRHRAAFGRSRERASVNLDVPYSSHTRSYRGHCNTETVKDVNFYGLNDEYVVSGSDDGHLFIWDRKTTKIVNILKGDGEIVNVVQGHPYEPMIACSGIDSTVKIFGPGGESRERDRASRGIDVANPGGALHSSLRFGVRRRRDQDMTDSTNDQNPQTAAAEVEVADEEEIKAAAAKSLKSCRALHNQYRITSDNDSKRRRRSGMDSALVSVSDFEALNESLFIRAWLRGQLRRRGG